MVAHLQAMLATPFEFPATATLKTTGIGNDQSTPITPSAGQLSGICDVLQ